MIKSSVGGERPAKTLFQNNEYSNEEIKRESISSKESKF